MVVASDLACSNDEDKESAGMNDDAVEYNKEVEIVSTLSVSSFEEFDDVEDGKEDKEDEGTMNIDDFDDFDTKVMSLWIKIRKKNLNTILVLVIYYLITFQSYLVQIKCNQL